MIKEILELWFTIMFILLLVVSTLLIFIAVGSGAGWLAREIVAFFQSV